MLSTDAQVRSAERVLSFGTWSITVGAVLFSVLTVTPLMRAHTPPGWQWTAPILPLVVDAAVVIVVRLDATLARLGGNGGRWPVVLRWLTGLFTLALNVGQSALTGDLVGVSVHLVAPSLLIVTSEAGLAYRRAIAAALSRIERERDERADREQAERSAREEAQRAEREREREARERREREAREHQERLEREAREHAAQVQREEREHAAKLERERAEREDARQRAEWERSDRERRERAEREQREREAAEREQRERAAHEQREQAAREQREREAAEREQRERAARERRAVAGEQPARVVKAAPVNPSGTVKFTEAEALTAIREGARAGRSVRELADLTGWSVGWVSARLREARELADAPAHHEAVA